MKIILINGPNLNLLGVREPEKYGKTSFESFFKQLKATYQGKHDLAYFQRNSEDGLVNLLHEHGFSGAGIILNAGAFTHTSIALADAVAAIQSEVIEVHISNIHNRESFRHQSLVGRYCRGMISGLGLKGYLLAIEYFSQS